MARVPDESQRQAIYAPPEQSILVMAPPGYGKTYVMPKRIAFLIKGGHLAPPERALGLTFTNAAASEMLSRMSEYIGKKYLDYVDAMTFHSFCYHVLRANGDAVGLPPDFSIYPESAKRKLYERSRKSNKRYGREYKWDYYQNWENDQTIRLRGDADTTCPFWKFWQGYQNQLKAKGRVDFNHLLWFTYELFQQNPSILNVYRMAYRFILVDEYQDTSPLQFALLKLLVRGNTEGATCRQQLPVFIFGDDWQSIYSFLGAVPETQLENAKRLFGCATVELRVNHRVSSPALSLFSKVLRDESDVATTPADPVIPLLIARTPAEMAAQVDNQVSDWVGKGIALHDIAILSRQRTQLENIHKALSFDYLSVPDLQAKGIESNVVYQALLRVVEGKTTSPSLQDHLENHTYEDDVSKGERYIRRILIDLAGNYDLRFRRLTVAERAKLMVNEVLLEINWGEQLRKYYQNRLFTGTVHSAKGLEFRAVAIVHLDQGNFPNNHFVCQYCKNGKLDENSLQEEWRIFYVGITRASEYLALFSSATSLAGQATPLSCMVEPKIQSYLQIIDNRLGESIDSSLYCQYRKNANTVIATDQMGKVGKT